MIAADGMVHECTAVIFDDMPPFIRQFERAKVEQQLWRELPHLNWSQHRIGWTSRNTPLFHNAQLLTARVIAADKWDQWEAFQRKERARR